MPRKSASTTEDPHLHLSITSICFPCHANGFSTHTPFLSDLTYFSTLPSTLVLTSKFPILLLTQSFHFGVLYLYCTMPKLTNIHVNFSPGVLSWGKNTSIKPETGSHILLSFHPPCPHLIRKFCSSSPLLDFTGTIQPQVCIILYLIYFSSCRLELGLALLWFSTVFLQAVPKAILIHLDWPMSFPWFQTLTINFSAQTSPA